MLDRFLRLLGRLTLLLHASDYLQFVSIRQRTSAYVAVFACSAASRFSFMPLVTCECGMSACVSVRQHSLLRMHLNCRAGGPMPFTFVTCCRVVMSCAGRGLSNSSTAASSAAWQARSSQYLYFFFTSKASKLGGMNLVHGISHT